MKTDDLKDLFDQLDFDLAQPQGGHEERFRSRLKTRSKKKIRHSGVISMLWPTMAIAAAVAVAVLVFRGDFMFSASSEQGLASVSPEMKQTENFYDNLIQSELQNLKDQKNPQTQAIIEDALEQMAKLEYDYENLEKDLGKSGQDQRVIYAMINNFQQRIDLLKTVLDKVNSINTLTQTNHENNLL